MSAEALRRGDYDGPIRMIAAEPHRPYDRPPLSKELLLGAGAEAPPALRPAIRRSTGAPLALSTASSTSSTE